MDERWSKRRLAKWVVPPVLILGVLGGLAFLFFRPTETTLPVSIRLIHLAEELVVVGKVPPVEAHLQGRIGVLTALEDSKLLYQVDMAAVGPGKTFHEIDKDQIAVPENVSVTSVDPASFVIRVDKKAEKLVPVLPDPAGQPTAGYVISSIEASPARVEIQGPATVLDQISAVRTTPIDLTGLKESTKRDVALNLSDMGEVQVSGDGLIEVAIEIEKEIVEKWVERQVRPTGTDFPSEVTPSRIRILLKGPENLFKELVENDGIDVRVDLEGLSPGTYFRHAVIEPPLDMAVLETEPKTFRVEVLPKNR